MGAGPYLQIDVGSGNAEITKEDVGHFFVIVLAGVDETVFERYAILLSNRPTFADALDDRRHFHEVGARAGNDEQFEFSRHWLIRRLLDSQKIGPLTPTLSPSYG